MIEFRTEIPNKVMKPTTEPTDSVAPVTRTAAQCQQRNENERDDEGCVDDGAANFQRGVEDHPAGGGFPAIA